MADKDCFYLSHRSADLLLPWFPLVHLCRRFLQLLSSLWDGVASWRPCQQMSASTPSCPTMHAS
jgi:hypothetical protein